MTDSIEKLVDEYSEAIDRCNEERARLRNELANLTGAPQAAKFTPQVLPAATKRVQQGGFRHRHESQCAHNAVG